MVRVLKFYEYLICTERHTRNLAGWVLKGRQPREEAEGGIELAVLPRTTRLSPGRGYGNSGSPDKIREGKAVLVQKVLHFAPTQRSYLFLVDFDLISRVSPH